MKVILLQELKGRGGEGDVVEVAKGFANNFLFPKNIAVPATEGNLKQLKQRKHNIAKREENRLDDAGKEKEAFEGIVVKIEAKVGAEGRLFGSVTAQMIAESLQLATGVEVDKKRIDLKEPIKTAGDHEVAISLYRDIKASLKLFVGDIEKETPAEEVVQVEEVTEDVAIAEVATDEQETNVGADEKDAVEATEAQ